jgi:hypothetical protein
MKLAVFLAFGLSLLAADPAPQWVRDVAAQNVPSYVPKVSKVVLLQEEHLTVAPDGRRVIRERGALKFVQRDKSSAAAYRTYHSKSGRIRDFQAWLIAPDGSATTLGGKNQVIDIALSQNF